MKTVGIAMLFGLCSLIGMRLAAKKTEELGLIRSIRNDLLLFSERIAAGIGTLPELANERNGALSDVLQVYLDTLSEGYSEADAAERAVGKLNGYGSVQAGVKRFLTGLS